MCVCVCGWRCTDVSVLHVYVYVHVCVQFAWCVGVHLCKIKSMSAGRHSDKINMS